MNARVISLFGTLVTVLLAVASATAADPFEVVFPEVTMEDPATLCLERVGDRVIESAVVPGKRLREITVSFTSFSWAGEDWNHNALVFLPVDGIPEHARGKGSVVAGVRPYAEASAAVLGIPSLLITSGNPGPHYGEPKEGELMGHSLERQGETGDPRWNGYAWLGKVLVRGVTVLASLPETQVREAVVTGCSKRGMASWIAVAADRRVIGAFPTCWNTGNYDKTGKLLLDRFGGDYQPGRDKDSKTPHRATKAPAFVTVREQYERTQRPEFRALAPLLDPVVFRDRIADKAILYATGTSDPLYHVLACNLVLPELSGEKGVLLVPNADHTPNTEQHRTAWTMWLAHCCLGRDVPRIVVETVQGDNEVTVTARVATSTRVEDVAVWWAAHPAGTYLESKWRSVSMSGAEGLYRATLPRPVDAYVAFFVAVRDDDPGTCPGYTTSPPFEIMPDTGQSHG